MANTIILKKSSVAGAIPAAAQLQPGELAVNLADAKLYTKRADGTVITVGSSAAGGASVVVSDTPPSSPSDNTLWWDSANGNLKIYYNDGTSSQWVEAHSGVVSNTSNALANARTISMTGDVAWSVSFDGSGNVSAAGTIQPNVVVNADLAQVAANTFKGRATTGTGNVEDLSAAQATAMLDTFSATLKGLTPASGGGTTNFLRADGTWAEPPGGGGGISSVAYTQSIKTANYTLVLGDAGKQIFLPVSAPAGCTFTIPANASVAFPTGTVVLFTVENGARPARVAINSDTLVFGSGTTGTITVPPGNTLECIKVTETKWLAYYRYQTGIAAKEAVAVAQATSPGVNVYPWSSSTGFGTRYANAASLPTGTIYTAAFHPSGQALILPSTNSPNVIAYSWSSAGFGSRYTDPAVLPTSGYSALFSPAGDSVALSSSVSPYIAAYAWTNALGFGTKYANPATLPANLPWDLSFHPAGTAIAGAISSATPSIIAYPWSSATGFGTKYADPSTAPAGTGYSVAFSPAGDAVAVVHANSPFVSVYPWSSSTGFGTKYADPATLPPSASYFVAFSPGADAIVTVNGTAPYVAAYQWSSAGFGAKYTNPATPPTGVAYGVGFSTAGDAVVIAHNITPFVSAYAWNSATGFGTKYADPAVLPTSYGQYVSFTLNMQ